ncbi:MAG: hypothetical protein ACOYBL_06420 [Lachnospiraceae bacterium]|jgi:hypothetical protein
MDFNQIGKVQKVKACIDKFQENHPKFPLFLKAVSQDALKEGTLMEITVTTPDEKSYCTNIRIKAEDMELMEMLKEIRK